jgi:nicotinamide-nucleotide amidase
MFPSPFLRLAEVVLADARTQKLRIATAESCTGGLIAALLTEIPGSSDAFDRGFVVYSNRAKSDLLGVPGDLIADAGAVSEAVARSMAEGAVENSNAHLAVSVTGVAGPAAARNSNPSALSTSLPRAKAARSFTKRIDFGNIGRSEIRMKAVEAALQLLHRLL